MAPTPYPTSDATTNNILAAQPTQDPSEAIMAKIAGLQYDQMKNPDAATLLGILQQVIQANQVAQQHGTPLSQQAANMTENSGAQNIINKLVTPANQSMPGWNISGRPYQQNAIMKLQSQEEAARKAALNAWALKNLKGGKNQAAFNADPAAFVAANSQDPQAGVLANLDARTNMAKAPPRWMYDPNATAGMRSDQLMNVYANPALNGMPNFNASVPPPAPAPYDNVGPYANIAMGGAQP